MDSFSKSEKYQKQLEKESGKVVQKVYGGGEIGLNGLKPSEVDFITSNRPYNIS